MQAFGKLIADLPAPKLGLSSVGGDAAAAVTAAVGSVALPPRTHGMPRCVRVSCVNVCVCPV